MRSLAGVVLHQVPLCDQISQASPIRQGSDVSWIPRVTVGDNQRDHPACVMFAWAKWAEIMFQSRITDAECVDAWRIAREKFNNGDLSGGLQLDQGHAIARQLAWIPSDSAFENVSDLSQLGRQPIVAAYKVTPDWDLATKNNGLIANTTTEVLGLHAVCICAHGDVTQFGPTRLVYHVGSWGISWGWRGFGVLTESCHNTLICELAISS